MKSSEIRQKYLEFFKNKGHKIIPSASLIPENDPSTLFTSSGMQPLVPYLLGEKHPEGTKLCDSQKCFRSWDIEEVGDGRHDTFFEMLGNWSLGEYFKKEQLPWIYEFLVDELKIDPQRLYATVFRGAEEIGVRRDMESVEILKEIFKKYGVEAKDVDSAEEKGMQDGRIFYYPVEKNWWSRSGTPAEMPVGEPGGPDSEIFFDLGAELEKHENSKWADKPCHLNCDCGRFVEIGNSVFMQYRKTENGFEKLAQQNVDFGGGLERIMMAVQGTDNIFETHLFSNIINKVESLSGKKYRDSKRAFEVVADHLKASTFIMGDDRGVPPSNVGVGYIVRRLVRRAIRFGKQLGIKENDWIKEIAVIVADDYGQAYPELKKNLEFVKTELSKEQEKFERTLDAGVEEINKLFKNYNGDLKEFFLSAKNLFDLYQSFGFPIELSLEEINLKREENGGTSVPVGIQNHFIELFKKELEKHQELSRTASAGTFKGGLADNSDQTTKLHTAAHLMLAGLRKILGEHVQQKGSNITAERLRFDFSHTEKLTPEEIHSVENFVNDIINKDMKVVCEEMPLEKAKELNATGVFESKYGERVKVYTVSKDGEVASREICGGPHVERTGVLGKFKIVKEESSSSGVRRIKAILE